MQRIIRLGHFTVDMDMLRDNTGTSDDATTSRALPQASELCLDLRISASRCEGGPSQHCTLQLYRDGAVVRTRRMCTRGLVHS
jgi:hypothetical protein